MKIGVVGKPFKKSLCSQFKIFFKKLEQLGVELQVQESFHKFIYRSGLIEKQYETFSVSNEINRIDYMISIGGDGTLLEALTYIGDREIPILGINAGRLGFLATITIDKSVEAIDAIINSNFYLDERSLLKLDANADLFGDAAYAMNEFAILKRDTSSMIVVHTYLNDEFLNSYWADGLLVSTPTGSTGYSLSCAGPLVMPQTNNFIISPVNPHNLNVRPMIVSDNSTISFRIEGRSKKFLVSLDSRSKSVDASIELSVRKENFKAILIQLKDYSYFNTLRTKLNWGLDVRN